MRDVGRQYVWSTKERTLDLACIETTRSATVQLGVFRSTAAGDGPRHIPNVAHGSVPVCILVRRVSSMDARSVGPRSHHSKPDVPTSAQTLGEMAWIGQNIGLAPFGYVEEFETCVEVPRRVVA